MLINRTLVASTVRDVYTGSRVLVTGIVYSRGTRYQYKIYTQPLQYIHIGISSIIIHHRSQRPHGEKANCPE